MVGWSLAGVQRCPQSRHMPRKNPGIALGSWLKSTEEANRSSPCVVDVLPNQIFPHLGRWVEQPAHPCQPERLRKESWMQGSDTAIDVVLDDGVGLHQPRGYLERLGDS